MKATNKDICLTVLSYHVSQIIVICILLFVKVPFRVALLDKSLKKRSQNQKTNYEAEK